MKPLRKIEQLRLLNQAELIATNEGMSTEFFDLFNNPLLQQEIQSGDDSGRHLKDLLIHGDNDSKSSNTNKTEERIATD